MQPAVINQFVSRLTVAFQEGDPEVRLKSAEAANIAVLEAQYQAIAAGRFADVLATCAEDIELEIFGPPDMPFAGKWQGRDQVFAALQRNYSMIADQEPEIESVTAQGDTVVILAHERGRFVKTGRPYDVTWVQVFQFRNGKVARCRELVDTATLVQAAEPASR